LNKLQSALLYGHIEWGFNFSGGYSDGEFNMVMPDKKIEYILFIV